MDAIITIIGVLIYFYLMIGCFKCGQAFPDARDIGDVPWRDFFSIVYGWAFKKWKA